MVQHHMVNTLPPQQLQQRSAEHAEVLNKLADGQAQLDARLEELQELMGALQGRPVETECVIHD